MKCVCVCANICRLWTCEVNGVDSCIISFFLSLFSVYSRTMERDLCSVEMTEMRAFFSLATIMFLLPPTLSICQSTIVLVATMGYCYQHAYEQNG